MIVDVARGVALLRAGGIVAYPTETVYGLGADATSPAAVARLQQLKGRDADRGLSVLVEGPATISRWAPDGPPLALRLAERFWPGPLTLVVPTECDGLACVATDRGVGFRCSPHPTAAAIARDFGRPVVSTSCNRSGESPCRDAAEVAARFGADLPVVGGEPAGGEPPSTVVAVARRGGIEILREGATPADAVRAEARA